MPPLQRELVHFVFPEPLQGLQVWPFFLPVPPQLEHLSQPIPLHVGHVV